MAEQDGHENADRVQVINPHGRSSAVLVCEHATAYMPPEFDHLGLPADLRKSHVVWDPGAMEVAERLSQRLDAALVVGAVSRLVYDCNRPPDAADAMPSRSEVIDIPGNLDLDAAAREDRIARFYAPFKATLAETIRRVEAPLIITVHSFTPIFHGVARTVEIGVLHDADSRLADAMLRTAKRHTGADVQRNMPYGPEHGVTHTLREHALPHGHLNVMIEIRNDLIATRQDQFGMGDMLAEWIADTAAQIGVRGGVTCMG